MPTIIIADEAGACYGVERALQLVRDAAATSEGPVFTLGPLIHNPIVVSELAEAGVGVTEGPEGLAPGSTLVLRTHGVTPDVEAAAREAGVVVLDATCPHVKRSHLAAERLTREGYRVVVLGEQGHPEVEGTVGHAPEALVVGSAEEARELTLSKKKDRVGVVVQTTQSEPNLRAVVSELVGRVRELRVVNTICEATSEHQGACTRLAAKADVMIVIGGHNSANTTHLADIARELCPCTHHVESVEELEASWFEGAETIGITAGASTPQAHIELVRATIEQMTEH